MGFKVPQHWGILGAKISIHDRAKYMILSPEKLQLRFSSESFIEIRAN
jgi:hypothetical protein